MRASQHRRTLHGACPPMAGMLLAAGVSLAAIVVQCMPALAELLQWQRGNEAGWSWLTSHLCHWSWNHLTWDLATFGFLSWLSLRLSPSRYATCLLVAAALIPLEVQIAQPLLGTYRGLSGIDCALMGLLVAALWRPLPDSRNRLVSKCIAVLATCAFVAKTTHELTTGGTVFVAAGADHFVPVPSAHLVGFVSGLVVGLLPWGRRERHLLSSGEPRTRPA